MYLHNRNIKTVNIKVKAKLQCSVNGNEKHLEKPLLATIV